jgi:hypothetical protein
MAPRVTHTKVSSRPAGNDPGRIYGPDWNDNHVIEGLTIGIDVQAHNTNLDNLSAFDGTAGLVAQTAASSFAKRTLTGTAGRITVSNGDGGAGNPAVDIAAGYVGQSSITTVGAIGAGTWQGTRVAEGFGGTNQSTYTLGDILYASAGNTLSKLGGNTTSAKKFLRQTGTGSVSAAPAWDTLVNGDITSAGVALTSSNDTNVTISLGGAPSTALINAASLTMGWAGTLSGARGGTGTNNGANTITVGGNLSTVGAVSLPSIAQGDLWFGSATGVKSALAKNSSATRYLANTGTSNNPAWDQVNLGNGVTGTLGIANGGTAQSSAAAARGSSGLNVESFTGHGDSNYTILAADKVVGSNAAFTASRTWTLPAANAVNPGQPLVVADFQGTVTGTNTLVISRIGSDTINGGTSVTVSSANGAYILWSDGASKWTAQAIGAAAASGVSTFNGRSGAVTPAQGDYTANLVPGTTTNDNAAAGNIGEYVEALLASGSAVPLTSVTAKSVTSISLTAGDWDVTGKISFSINNSTTVTWAAVGISTTNNAMPSNGLTSSAYMIYNGMLGSVFPADSGFITGPTRLSLSGATSVYLVGFASFAASTMSAYGEIRARRIR